MVKVWKFITAIISMILAVLCYLVSCFNNTMNYNTLALWFMGCTIIFILGMESK